MATAIMSHGADTGRGIDHAETAAKRENPVGDEFARGVRIARRGDPGRQIRGVVSVVRRAGEGPGPARRLNHGIDEKARNGDAFRRLCKCGAIDDALRGEDNAPCRLSHQHVLEAGADDASVPGRIGLLNMENRNVRNQGGHDVDCRLGIRIGDRLKAPRRRQIRAVEAGHRHERNTLDRGPQSGNHRRAGMLARLHRAGLNRLAVGRGHAERRLISDESGRYGRDTSRGAKKIDVVRAGSLDDLQPALTLAHDLMDGSARSPVQRVSTERDPRAVRHRRYRFFQCGSLVAHRFAPSFFP